MRNIPKIKIVVSCVLSAVIFVVGQFSELKLFDSFEAVKLALTLLVFTFLGLLAIILGGTISIWIIALRKHFSGTVRNLILYVVTLFLAPVLMTVGVVLISLIGMLNYWSKKETAISKLKSVSNKVVVIFIHGTFQPDAPWTHEQSPLSKAIEKKFNSKSVIFDRFIWSGANLMAERTKAAKRLQAVIKHYQQEHCSVHLVAHSHGGGVVLEALDERTAPDSVTFMATPFISFETLQYSGLSKTSLNFGIFTAMACFISVIYYFVGQPTFQMIGMLFARTFALFSLIYLAYIYFVRARVSACSGSTLSQKIAIHKDSTRIYISNGDEAGAVLQFSSLVASGFRNLTANFFEAAAVLDETASEGKMQNANYDISHVLFLCICTASVLTGLLMSLKFDVLIAMLVYFITAILISAFLTKKFLRRGTVSEHISTYLIFHCGMTAIANALTKVAFGYTVTEAVSRHEIHITSSETPVGTWTVEKSPSDGLNRLQHSKVYQDELSQANIATFIWERTSESFR